MIQAQLFEVDKGRDGATWQVGNHDIRNWRGWYQFREGGKGNWQFYVPWFSNDNVTCTVTRIAADGKTYQQDGVPIDGANRILIEGKRYGRSHWDH